MNTLPVVKKESTEIELFVDVRALGATPSKTQTIIDTYEPMTIALKAMLLKTNAINSLPNGKEKIEKSKRFRLDVIAPIVKASEENKVELKADILLEGRVIDGANNAVKLACSDITKQMKKNENYFIDLANQVIIDNYRERLEKLLLLDASVVPPKDLGVWEDTFFDTFYDNTKFGIENRKIAEEQTRLKGIEDKRVLDLHNTRVLECSGISTYIDDFKTLDFGNMEDVAYKALFDNASEKRDDAEIEAYNNKIIAENAEAETKKALKAQQVKQAKINKINNEKIAKEKAEKLKIQYNSDWVEAHSMHTTWLEEQKEAKRLEAEKNLLKASDSVKVKKFADDTLKYIAEYQIIIKDEDTERFFIQAISRITDELNAIKTVADK